MRLGARPPSLAPRLLPSILALLLFGSICINPSLAKESGPSITKTSFDHLPAGLFYFEDSEVILLHDQHTGTLTRSANAGETWESVATIPKGKARSLWQHPFDNQKAYMLSAGHEHWYTHDRGETWTRFDTAASPSPWREPLTFHAGDPDRILFQAEACKSFFECDEVVSLSRLHLINRVLTTSPHADLVHNRRLCHRCKTTPFRNSWLLFRPLHRTLYNG